MLCRVEELAAHKGVSRVAAIAIAPADAGVQKSAYYDWKALTNGLDREDWLAALAPSFSPAVDGVVPDMADIHPDAWMFLKSDYRSTGTDLQIRGALNRLLSVFKGSSKRV
ncbi:DNA-binding domain-containing protein [Rhizobium oryziradicis]|uniref:DNA-binding domain-containing protein n=1 Tax=Rhizobium oryziradicis TaxID=1867956 RepID=UPI000ABF2AFA|nr:DNA-binding domain-containing protein [Rhizobium oryziradicis]